MNDDVTDNQPGWFVLFAAGTFVAVVIAYDLWRLWKYGRAGTISRWLWVEASKSRLAVFMAGVASGVLLGGLAVHVLGLY